MFFTQEGQKLYLSNVQYNIALMLTELEKIVTDRGGKVEKQTSGYIVNRSLYNKFDETERNIKAWESSLTILTGELKEKAEKAILKHEHELIEIREKIEHIEPEHVTRLSYIRFVLDGFVYYFQTDNNPFFPFYYNKAEVRKDDTYSKDASLEESKKEWLYDCFFNEERMTNADLKECAFELLNELEAAKPSVIRRDSEKIRVPNWYNGGYHYETVYKPERVAKIDF